MRNEKHKKKKVWSSIEEEKTKNEISEQMKSGSR